MKKVLIIADLFHASPRIPGLAKYLPEFGWEPIVITGSSPEDTFGIKFKFLKTTFPNVFESWKRRLHLNTTSGFQKQIGVPLKLRANDNSITNNFFY